MSFTFAPLEEEAHFVSDFPHFPEKLAKVLLENIVPEDFNGFILNPEDFKSVIFC